MATCLVGCCSLLSAADTPKDDSILANVKQLNEDQMQSVTGENVYYYYANASTNSCVLFDVYEDEYAHGYLLIDYDTGNVLEQQVLCGPLDSLSGVKYAPDCY
mgnify:CR=1 FL=1